MPGLCVIAQSGAGCPPAPHGQETDAPVRELLDRMLGRLRRDPAEWQESQADETAGIGLGRLALSFAAHRSELAVTADGQSWLALDGEVYDRAELAIRLRADRNNSAADLLLAGYQRAGREFFRSLHGKFVAAIWDGSARRLILVNDRFGMRPFFYACLPDRLIAASAIRAILADDAVPRIRNAGGLAQFFTFGQLLGQGTLLESIRALPAAAWMVWHAAERRLEENRYWRLAECQQAAEISDADAIENISSTFTRAVQRRLQGPDQLGLALSGGLDARCILAAIDSQTTPVKTFCLGVAGSLDHRSASRLAELADCSHHSHVLDDQFLTQFSRHMRRMVSLTDGHYLDQCIVLPTLPVYQRLGIQVLLRGHAGELLHMDKAYNFSLDNAGWAIRSSADLQQWLSRHLCAYMLDGVSGSPLAGIARRQVDELAGESLRSVLQDHEDAGEPLQGVWRTFIAERQRREVAMSLSLFGSVVETRVPFLDNDLVAAILAAPPRLLREDRVQRALLARVKPEFLSVVNANTGARVGAGRWTQRAATLRMKVLAKVGVKGYQPYERLGLWLRRELRDDVQRILLDDRCLERGAFDPNVTRAVVSQHVHRQRNHTFLLMAMMIYELGQRQLLDEPEGVGADGAFEADGVGVA